MTTTLQAISTTTGEILSNFFPILNYLFGIFVVLSLVSIIIFYFRKILK